MIRLTAVGLLLAATALHADDWPQFRGPGGKGVSTETGLPVTWGKDEGIRWKVDLPGRGLSSPVIADGRLYLTACTGPEMERLHVLCFNAGSGEKLWERQLWATGRTQCNKTTSMAAPTPVIDGKFVIALFATCDLVAFDRDGELRWYRALARDYPTIANNVGIAASPVLHEKTLFVPMETAGASFAVGIDADTGRNLWKDPRTPDICWTTPHVVKRGGRTEVVFQSASGLTAYEPKTGKRLWSFEAGLSKIPSLISSEGMIYAPAGALHAVKPGDGGAELAWESSRLGSATASPSIYKGRLYTVNSAGIVTCADPKDGAVLWKVRTKGPHSASPVFAEDRLYLVNNEGATSVIQLGDEPKVIATNELKDKIMASPALYDKAIYLRSDKTLYCIGAKP